jgi:hypothetical protein
VIQSELPQFSSLSFEEAVRLFRSWGFQVEPGPRPEEVTLILEAPDHRTYCVHPACVLPQMAAVALCVRMQNGAMYQVSGKLRQAGQRTVGSTITPVPTGNASMVLS